MGPRAGLDGCEKSPTGIRSQNVHPVAGCYIDWAITAHTWPTTDGITSVYVVIQNLQKSSLFTWFGRNTFKFPRGDIKLGFTKWHHLKESEIVLYSRWQLALLPRRVLGPVPCTMGSWVRIPVVGMNINHVCAVLCRQACDGSNLRLSRLSCSTKCLLNKTYRTKVSCLIEQTIIKVVVFCTVYFLLVQKTWKYFINFYRKTSNLLLRP